MKFKLSTDSHQIKINAKFIGQFYNLAHWKHRERFWLPNLNYGDILIYIDSNNNVVSSDHDFHRAHEQKTYPVKVYRLDRISNLPF